jgi:GT2 family glycosyltransferase
MFENFGCDLELTQNGLAFILPTYGAFDYARIAAQTFFEHTPLTLKPFCILLDDASPNYEQQDWEAWYEGLPRERCCHYHYPENGGLTRSWNNGLQLAHRYYSRYAITGNSDIRFTPNWHIGLRDHLRNGAQLVGPVSNAPGRTHHNDQRQNVRNWFPNYQLTDDPEQLLLVANYLHNRHHASFIERDINGFFMMAETATWMDGRFDEQHVFDPRNKMVGNEDELVKRWRKNGFKVGFVPSSFIFHYRSVSRVVRGVDVGRYRLKQEQ